MRSPSFITRSDPSRPDQIPIYQINPCFNAPRYHIVTGHVETENIKCGGFISCFCALYYHKNRALMIQSVYLLPPGKGAWFFLVQRWNLAFRRVHVFVLWCSGQSSTKVCAPHIVKCEVLPYPVKDNGPKERAKWAEGCVVCHEWPSWAQRIFKWILALRVCKLLHLTVNRSTLDFWVSALGLVSKHHRRGVSQNSVCIIFAI